MLACERCHTESVWKPAEAARSTFDHDDQGRADAAGRLARRRGLHQVPPQGVFNLPFAEARQLRQRRLPPEPARRPPVRQARLRVVPLADVQVAQAVQDFDHTEQTRFDLGPRTQQAQLLRLPHQGARRAASRPARASTCHAKDNAPPRAVRRVRQPPRCETCHPSSELEVHAERVQPRHADQVQADRQARRGACRQCHRGKSPATSRTSRPGRPSGRSLHGLPRSTRTCTTTPSTAGSQGGAVCSRRQERRAGPATCTRRSNDRPARTTTSIARVTTRSAARSRWSRATTSVPCAECQPAATRQQDHVRRRSAECSATAAATRTRCTRARWATTCTNCHIAGTWEALRFNHNAPFPDDAKGEVKEFPLKGEHLKQQVRGLPPKRASSPRPTPRARPRAVTPGRRRAQGPARQQVRAVPRRDRRQHLQPQPESRVPARRRAPRGPVRRLPPVDHVQAAADQLLRLPPRARRPQGPVRHRVRAVPLDRRRSRTSSRCTTSATSRSRARTTTSPCERCHQDNRPLAGSGNLCINCHRQDDIHSNSLSPRCGECHTQWSFAPARFDHTHGRLQPDRPAPHAGVLRLPQERQLLGAVAAVRELPRRRRGAGRGGRHRRPQDAPDRDHVRATATTRTPGATRRWVRSGANRCAGERCDSGGFARGTGSRSRSPRACR